MLTVVKSKRMVYRVSFNYSCSFSDILEEELRSVCIYYSFKEFWWKDGHRNQVIPGKGYRVESPPFKNINRKYYIMFVFQRNYSVENE